MNTTRNKRAKKNRGVAMTPIQNNLHVTLFMDNVYMDREYFSRSGDGPGQDVDVYAMRCTDEKGGSLLLVGDGPSVNIDLPEEDPEDSAALAYICSREDTKVAAEELVEKHTTRLDITHINVECYEMALWLARLICSAERLESLELNALIFLDLRHWAVILDAITSSNVTRLSIGSIDIRYPRKMEEFLNHLPSVAEMLLRPHKLRTFHLDLFCSVSVQDVTKFVAAFGAGDVTLDELKINNHAETMNETFANELFKLFRSVRTTDLQLLGIQLHRSGLRTLETHLAASKMAKFKSFVFGQTNPIDKECAEAMVDFVKEFQFESFEYRGTLPRPYASACRVLFEILCRKEGIRSIMLPNGTFDLDFEGEMMLLIKDHPSLRVIGYMEQRSAIQKRVNKYLESLD